jgi:hypothetical protein
MRAAYHPRICGADGRADVQYVSTKGTVSFSGRSPSLFGWRRGGARVQKARVMRPQARKPTRDASKGVKYSSGSPSPSATVQSNCSILPSLVYSKIGSTSADRGSRIVHVLACIALDEGEIRCDYAFMRWDGDRTLPEGVRSLGGRFDRTLTVF